MPLPLLPLQILWMNLVTDGLPGLALGFEPAEPDVMQRRPHPPNESIFARGLGTHILWAGPLMGLIALLTGWAYWRAGDEAWQTMLFTVLTISQMFHVLAIRQERESLFGRGLLSNPLLLGAVLAHHPAAVRPHLRALPAGRLRHAGARPDAHPASPSR